MERWKLMDHLVMKKIEDLMTDKVLAAEISRSKMDYYFEVLH